MTGELTQERLKEVMHYDPETGLFIWKVSAPPNGKIGSVAGYTRKDGRCVIGFKGELYLRSRLAFLYMEGFFPQESVDHINRITSDDRWSNLRSVSQRENLSNTGLRSNNKSGYKGVSFHAEKGKWGAAIKTREGKIFLGYYSDPLHAAHEYNKAAVKYFGEFAVLNPI
jgi:hypothetical protein